MKNQAAYIRTRTNSLERRLHGRQPCGGSIFFASPKRIYEGTLLNYSRGGLAVRISERFSEGQILIVALPFENAAPPKCKARVVWCNGKGFGVRFLR
jgi:hypothetical protein